MVEHNVYLYDLNGDPCRETSLTNLSFQLPFLLNIRRGQSSVKYQPARAGLRPRSQSALWAGRSPERTPGQCVSDRAAAVGADPRDRP